MPDLIMSIDQGTTGSTVLLIDTQSNVVSRGYQEFPQIYPQPGWVEHDPEKIWESVLAAAKAALESGNVSASDIRAIGITNQRETVVAWNKDTGKPYHNAIVWQCRRTAPLTNQMKGQGLEELFVKKTGLLLDPYFSGTKINWLFENVGGLREQARSGRVQVGTIDTFLIWKLTGGASHVTDVTNASRTLLMDLKKHVWDDELCKILEVPKNVLPRILGSADLFGKTRGVPGIPDEVPVCGVAGDQQAALFGQACFTPGEAKCTFGTGAFLLMNTGEKPVASKNRLLTTVAWQLNGKTTYALEGSAFIAGALVQWLRDELQLINNAPEVEALAQTVEDTGGVILVPALAGLSAPHWRSEARGIIMGITRGTNRGHMARAALEGIAMQNVEILQAMEADSGKDIVALKVDGGASANNLLMQMQSDFLGTVIVRPKMLETTAFGAAFLAGLGAGLFSDLNDIKNTWKKDQSFDPQMNDEQRTAKLKAWREVVAKA